MLRSLYIENMAVIKQLELEVSAGFTALTGETGAGKSVITDSINFLVCNKISRDIIRSGESRAKVSAVFCDLTDRETGVIAEYGVEIFDGEIVLERTLTADGRTTCRIDGRVATQQLMRKVGQALISIHGQHDTQRLSEESERISALDTFAHSEELLAAYSEKYNKWTETRRELSLVRKSAAEISRLRDMLEFQIKDIRSAKLRSGEEEELVTERARLQSAERIKKQTDIAARTLFANEKGITASSLALRAAEALSKVADVVPEYGDLAARLRSCTYELDDISSELRGIADGSDFTEDPSRRLDVIESRLALIGRLKKKYGPTVEDIIEFGKRAEAELALADGSDGKEEELVGKEKAQREVLESCSHALSAARASAAFGIEREVCDTLRFLDMPKVRFSVVVSDAAEYGELGGDKVDFLIAANPGEPLMPLSKSASGGELSRVMLAVKCALAEADMTGTLIFDEVDTGISGKTSRKVGIKLKQASRTAQVLSVTHSAQIASLAHTHLLVSKTESEGRAEANIHALDDDGRVEETARILGGINITDSQRHAAIDMINEGKNL